MGHVVISDYLSKLSSTEANEGKGQGALKWKFVHFLFEPYVPISGSFRKGKHFEIGHFFIL